MRKKAQKDVEDAGAVLDGLRAKFGSPASFMSSLHLHLYFTQLLRHGLNSSDILHVGHNIMIFWPSCKRLCHVHRTLRVASRIIFVEPLNHDWQQRRVRVEHLRPLKQSQSLYAVLKTSGDEHRKRDFKTREGHGSRKRLSESPRPDVF